ncbi:hypothetical protein ABTF13_20765, partial [Acinetobacter baumannii]
DEVSPLLAEERRSLRFMQIPEMSCGRAPETASYRAVRIFRRTRSRMAAPLDIFPVHVIKMKPAPEHHPGRALPPT